LPGTQQLLLKKTEKSLFFPDFSIREQADEE
jgi:hypothetical protein